MALGSTYTKLNYVVVYGRGTIEEEGAGAVDLMMRIGEAMSGNPAPEAMEPRIQYAKTKDGVSIAYCVMGDGPPLVFVPPPPFSHVQLDWETSFAYLFQPMARAFRFVWFDSRGTGLSDRDAIDFSIDAMLRDIEAVVARNGLETFAFASIGAGVPIAVTYAATHPERITHLVLSDGWAKWSDVEQLPAWQAEKALRGQDWDLYTEGYSAMMWGIDDPEFSRMMGKYLRACVEPEAHEAAFAAWEDYDISGLLPRIAAPTLVVQNQNSRLASFQAGQRLAGRIPDASFLPVDDAAYAHRPSASSLPERESEQGAPPAAARPGRPSHWRFRRLWAGPPPSGTSTLGGG